MAKKFSNYGSVIIYLLNFTTDEDIKSFLEFFFVEKDTNVFCTRNEVAWKVAKDHRTKWSILSIIWWINFTH